MKKLLTLITLGLTLALGTAHAADDKAPAKKPTKLAQCSSEAKGLKGDEYKKKRDECMKGDAAPAAAGAPAASPACEKSAADKKLHGAAKNAHIKKCMADAK